MDYTTRYLYLVSFVGEPFYILEQVRQFAPRVNVQFAINIFEMRCDGRRADAQRVRNFGVLFSGNGERGDLTFAQSQGLPARVRRAR